ncbi:MAG: Crp/Fnr family transcriptional regulator [Beduini sp.]|uniref:Crp/Fnr family transcriptional regulator n=1 Tax=Beduini sp. TaxID=1922300 RepID=UPI0011C7B75A
MKKIKIPESLFTYFEQAGQKRFYHQNSIIYMQEDQATDLYLITKGRVRVYSLFKDGREITIEIVEKGRIFGDSSFIQEATRPVSVSAVSDVELISCSLEAMLPYLALSPELTKLLFQLLSETCQHLSTLLDRSYFYDRYQKVAIFLLEQTRFTNEDKGIRQNELCYSHEEIGECVGLNRVTVTKILNEFQENRWILLSYKKITILNREGLESIIN